MDTAESIAGSSRQVESTRIHAQVKQHIDTHFPSLDSLLAQHGQPSTDTGSIHSLKRIDSRRSGKEKQKRTLEDEIAHWTAREAAAKAELHQTHSTLPGTLSDAQKRLQRLLESAQSISLERYALADKLANLVAELDSSTEINGAQHAESSGRRQTVLEQMEIMSIELSRLEAGLAWVSVLEQVVTLSEEVLSPASHHPSPLAALPRYQTLHRLVEQMRGLLPEDMSLLTVVVDLRNTTWGALKDVMSQQLLQACGPLKWPLRVDYASVPSSDRRAFERAYQDLLFLQAEGEAMGILIADSTDWSTGSGLYPLQAMVQPISLRFKYHFQGSRNTNRIDKPEWAFSNILDQIYEHQAFLEDYIQPLTENAAFGFVDVKSEFTMLLFPILLGMLRARIPRLLDHPALLAHTIYQTVLFDESIREGGFNINAVSLMECVKAGSWEGLAGVLLKDEGWFTQWLAGEKKFADAQLNDAISSSEAWSISDEVSEEENGVVQAGLKPTTSARQVKALIEQITDRYTPLPSLEYRLPFLTSIQLPILATYYSRISGSLDAFETLSSAFVRHVPGALSGNTRSGVHIEPARLTGGSSGLDRLVKAYLSASWILIALRIWSDDTFFIEMSTELKDSIHLRWKLHDDVYLPAEFKSAASVSRTGTSVFDTVTERYETLKQRAEDMMVRHVTAEVQNELKEHLKRRWDQEAMPDEPVPDTSLIHALSSYSSHLSTLQNALPHLIVSKVYRRIVGQLSNHISQRAVYSGWSKFTSFGGQQFLNEIKDWVQTSTSALQNGSNGTDLDILGPDAISLPWMALLDASRILSLPGEDAKGLPTFSQAMAAAWSDGEESRVLFCQRAGVESMDAAEMQGVLRRRVECWR